MIRDLQLKSKKWKWKYEDLFFNLTIFILVPMFRFWWMGTAENLVNYIHNWRVIYLIFLSYKIRNLFLNCHSINCLLYSFNIKSNENLTFYIIFLQFHQILFLYCFYKLKYCDFINYLYTLTSLTFKTIILRESSEKGICKLNIRYFKIFKFQIKQFFYIYLY